jgi:hypothetical protein
VPAAVRSYLERPSELAKVDCINKKQNSRARRAAQRLNAGGRARQDIDPNGEPAVEQAAKMPCPL